MSINIELLDFNHLDDEVSLESSKNEADMLDFRDIQDVSEESLFAHLKDFDLVSEVVTGMHRRRGVCKADVASLEALRKNHSELDSFLTDTPLNMYTVESTAVMFEESLENFVSTAANTLWDLLVRLAKYIWSIIKAVWDKLFGKMTITRKVDAKLSAFTAIRRYIAVGVSIIDEMGGESAIRSVRNRQLQNVDRTHRKFHQAYLDNIKEYDELIQVMTSSLFHGMDILNTEVSNLVRQLKAAKTASDVETLSSRYDKVIADDVAFIGISGNVERVLSRIPTANFNHAPSNAWSPRTAKLFTKLSTLAISLDNDNVDGFNPALFDKILSSNFDAFTPIDSKTLSIVTSSIPSLMKDIQQFSNNLNNVSIANPEVSAAFSSSNLSNIISSYQRRITGISNLFNRLSDMLSVRNEVINTIVTAALDEARILDKWLIKNQKNISIQNNVRWQKNRTHLHDYVKKAKL